MTRGFAQGQGGWDGAVTPLVTRRADKPRRTGLTLVLDKGLGCRQLRDLLEVAAPYIDFLKFGFGTAALYDREVLSAKVALCREWDVATLPGGTFFEYAAALDETAVWLDRVAALGFTAVEISDGSLDMAAAVRRAAIRDAQMRGLRVLAEVGRKHASRQLPAAALQQQLRADLAAGAEHVSVEGRESGQGVGIYAADGSVVDDDVEGLLAGLPDEDRDRLIWEAPRKDQQLWLLDRFGANVSLGNIAPADVLALEAQRQGLRGDTLPAALAAAQAGPML